MKTCIQTLAIAALAVSLSYGEEEAPKGPKGPQPEKIFAKLDANSDGNITLDEFKAGPMAQKNPNRAAEVFAKIDANSDGNVTLEEFKAHKPGKGKGRGKGGKGGEKGGDAPEAGN